MEEYTIPSSHLWYTRRNGEVKGPFPSGSVRSFVLLGRLELTDEVSADQEHWFPVRDVPDLVPVEVRDADTAEGQERLLRARLREDERLQERRSDEVSPEMERRRRGDRRAPEPDTVLSHRETRKQLWAFYRGGERNLGAALGWLVVFAFVLGAGVFVYTHLPREPVAEPQCDAAPAAGVVWSNCALEGIDAAGADLRGARLDNADLRGADLHGADLSGAQLSYANLSTVDLRYANLTGAHLKGAGLRNAWLVNARFKGADLSFADLRGAEIGGALFDGARLDKAIWLDGRVCADGSVGVCR